LAFGVEIPAIVAIFNRGRRDNISDGYGVFID